MKNADVHMDALQQRIAENGCVLMLDFDGVLSPIVARADAAGMLPQTRAALTACAAKLPVAIISGRSLSDVEARTGLRNIVYAGSHGLEWKYKTRVVRKKIDDKDVASFNAARLSILQVAAEFPNVAVEDKLLCTAIGYRALSAADASRFRASAHKALEQFTDTRIRSVDNLFTFEVLVSSEWTKGECAKQIYNYFARTTQTRPVAIYIGDGLTDEDAFRAFPNDITIRVGKSKTSSAAYYFVSRSCVDAFLQKIARLRA